MILLIPAYAVTLVHMSIYWGFQRLDTQAFHFQLYCCHLLYTDLSSLKG